MNSEEVIEGLQKHLTDAGYKSALLPVQHVSDLQYDLNHLLEQGILKSDFYDEIVRRYDLDFQFARPTDFPTAQSILITASPQPKVIVKFTLSGTEYRVLIPPTYIHDSDILISKTISHYLRPAGYRIHDALLPEKLLAVHAGLAAYGKNNIAYIDGFGSYFRLKVVFSDLPCLSDTWQELNMMDQCENCSVCCKRCPTNAVKEDRFLLDAGRCIAYFNEGDATFPEWIDPSWHNCLVGCMICQDVCPVNNDFTQWTVEGEEFSEEETRMILEGVQEKKLPHVTVEKLRRLYMLDYYRLLQRNLGILLKASLA